MPHSKFDQHSQYLSCVVWIFILPHDVILIIAITSLPFMTSTPHALFVPFILYFNPFALWRVVREWSGLEVCWITMIPTLPPYPHPPSGKHSSLLPLLPPVLYVVWRTALVASVLQGDVLRITLCLECLIWSEVNVGEVKRMTGGGLISLNFFQK